MRVQVTFSPEECSAFGIPDLQVSDFVRAGNDQQFSYFQPKPPVDMKGADIAAAFAQGTDEIDTCAVFCRKYQVSVVVWKGGWRAGSVCCLLP